MADSSILIDFILDKTQFASEVMAANEAVVALTKQLQSTKDAASEVKDGFKSLTNEIERSAAAVLAFLAVQQIKDFASAAIDAAAGQEEAQHRLGLAMATTGEYTDASVASMHEFILALQATSRFSEETITNALSIAKTFGITNEQAQKLIQTSADLATQLGTDLNSQVERLGLTFSGTTARLTRSFPELAEFTAQQLQAGAAVDYLSDRLSGVAEGGLATYSGATLQAGFAQSEFLKSLGALVTDSPIAIARLQAMVDGYKNMQSWVTDNKTELQGLINDGIRALVVAVPLALDVLYYLVQVFEAIVGATLLATNGFLMLVDILANAVANTLGSTVDYLFELVQGWLNFIGMIPGGSAAMAAMGVDLEKVNTKIDEQRLSFSKWTDSVTEDLHSTSNSVLEFTDKTDSAFKRTDEVFDSFRTGIAKSAQAIVDADDSTEASAKKSIQNRDDYTKSLLLSAAEVEAFMKKLAALDTELLAVNQTSIEKVTASAKAMEGRIKELEDAGILSHENAENYKAFLSYQYAQKRLDIELKEMADADKALQEYLKKQSAAIQAAGNEPGKFIVTFGMDKESIQQMQMDAQDGLTEGFNQAKNKLTSIFTGSDTTFADWTDEQVSGGIAAAAGTLGTALKGGAAGAKDFFGSIFGSVVDAYLPGLGKVASQLFSLMAQDPATSEAQVKAFTAAIPEMSKNFVSAGPYIVAGMATALADPKFWVGLTEAYTKLFTLEAAWIQLGKAFGISVGDSLNADRFAKTVSDNWTKDMNWWRESGYKIGQDMATKFGLGLGSFLDSLQSAGDKIRIGFSEAPRLITQGFNDGVKSFNTAITLLGVQIGNVFRIATAAIGAGIITPFATAVSTFAEGIGTIFKSTFGQWKFPALPVFPPFPAIPDIKVATPGWLQSFSDAVNKLTGSPFTQAATGGVSGGSGGVQAFVNNVKSSVGLGSLNLTDAPSSSSSGNIADLLTQIVSLLQRPVTVKSTATLNGKALADIILNLNRQNARLA